MKEFKKGQRVAIIRHSHGWEDGRIEGKVINIGHRSGGAAYYFVKDDNGYEYDVRATRDLRELN